MTFLSKGKQLDMSTDICEKEDMVNNFSNSNVHNEYMEAFRTKSYVDMWRKAQFQIQTREECPSSPPFRPYPHLSDLLEPQQQTLLSMIDDSQPHALVLDYFNSSLEACGICSFLLQRLTQTRANHHIIQRVLQQTKQARGNYTDEQFQFITLEFKSFAKLENPLSGSSPVHFGKIHDIYGPMLNKLVSTRKKLKRKAEIIYFCKKASSLSLVAACGALSTVTIVLAAHTFVGLIATPIVIGSAAPFLKQRFVAMKNTRARSHMRLAQLDAAAKGAYILDRDFDTISRLTTRLHDEIEHNNAMIQMCLGTHQNKSLLKEVVKVLRNNELRFLEQLEELEEHIYLCFLTINRARRLVIEKMEVNRQH